MAATLAHHFEEGGWGMYPILWCSVILAAITIERARFFLRPSSRAEDLLHRIGWAIRAGDVKRALTFAVEAEGPSARVARAALLHWVMPVSVIESEIDAQVKRELAPARHRLGALQILAASATLLGLLGTVTGLFSPGGTPNADAASRATMLARGISEAMNCAAFGLFVTLCAIASAAAFHGAAARMADDLSATAQSLRNLLAEHRQQLRWDGLRAPVVQASYRENG